MPKPASIDMLSRYDGLKNIPADEWDNFFCRTGTPWDADENEYLQEWYGRELLIDLAYALERTPWTVHDHAITKLGIRIGSGRLRKTQSNYRIR